VVILDPLLLPNILVILFILALLIIAVANMCTLRNLNNYKNAAKYPRISALVPARNEEDSIGACVRSLLAQDYPDFQVIVLDDNSTDRTPEILGSLAQENTGLKIIKGNPLPSGWLGKHWACHQLSQIAGGEMLLFTDADTVHKPHMLRQAVSASLRLSRTTTSPRSPSTNRVGSARVRPIARHGTLNPAIKLSNAARSRTGTSQRKRLFDSLKSRKSSRLNRRLPGTLSSAIRAPIEPAKHISVKAIPNPPSEGSWQALTIPLRMAVPTATMVRRPRAASTLGTSRPRP